MLTTALDWCLLTLDDATEVAFDDGRGAWLTTDEAIVPTDGRIVLYEDDRDTLDGMFLTKSEYSPL